ncbi:integrase arm-type DNA-binding domain-containing protein [Xanthomonas translucens]|uniref:tyrosine-type recombinase/integrase n=1 Tax=Xanthomonas campestris pv. translucens TaxID=343 RepID=UPI001F2ED9F5|nr:integrase arm-type DNA-binding domain-containing protein [Xanthomonas translucens]UKE49540.1 integrase arm-type DNA-binding domain-containing protein [Xanthomonas translucens]
MPLTDTAIRRTKCLATPQKLRDGNGLYLLLRPDGARWWRYDYRRPVTGKRNTLSFGTYPEVSLSDARERLAEARRLLAAKIDPGEQRKAVKAAGEAAAANSFEVVAREWFAKQQKDWSIQYADKIIRRLQTDIFPWIGSSPIAAITAPELLKHLERIEQRGAIETAHRALQTCGAVFRYAVRTGRAEADPTGALKGALTPWRSMPFAAATTSEEATTVLRKVDISTSRPVVRSALRLAPLLFARPGELVRMRWAELDLDAGQWRYFVTKTKRTHIAALSTQAVEILRDLHPLTGRGEFVFPGGRDPRKHMSGNAILVAARRCGIEKDESTIHGFRHMASTLLNEMGGWTPDAIESALTHKMPGVRGIYNQAQYLDERRKMMQAWGDYTQTLRFGSALPLVKEAA